MTILWLVLLPIIGAAVIAGLRRWPIIIVPSSAAILLVMYMLSLDIAHTEYSFILGRLITLSPERGALLAYCYLLTAILVLASFRSEAASSNYTLLLLFIALVTIALTIEDNTLASLLLTSAAILLSIMLISSSHEKSINHLRTMSIILLAGPLLLFTIWALDRRVLDPNNITLMQLGGIGLIIAAILGLGLFPLCFWLPSAYKDGPPLAIFMIFIFQTILILRLLNIIYLHMWPEGQVTVLSLLNIAAVVTCIGAGVLAIFQNTLGGILAYTSIADMAFLVVGLSLGTLGAAQGSFLHLAYRGLALAGVSIGISSIHITFGSDNLNAIKGAWATEKLSVIGILLCGFSLTGIPLTAGFTTRLSILSAMGTSRITQIVLVTVGGFCPAIAWGRFALAARGRDEQFRNLVVTPAILCLAIGVLLVVLGVYPPFLDIIAPDAVKTLTSITLPLLR